MKATLRLAGPSHANLLAGLMRELCAFDHLAFDENVARGKRRVARFAAAIDALEQYILREDKPCYTSQLVPGCRFCL